MFCGLEPEQKLALFLSSFTNKLDAKGRVSLPAPFRSALGEDLTRGVVVFASHQYPCLEGFDFSRMAEISARLDRFDLFSTEQDDLATMVFGASVQLCPDADGRIILPSELCASAGLCDAVTFVGLGNKFQIWAPEAFEKRRTQARSAVKDGKLTIPNKGGAHE